MSPQNQVIVDDDLMMFARDQLTISLAKVSNKVYPSLKYTQYFPVVNLPGYEWENTFEIVEFDSFGIATVLADSANDGGEVGVVARRQRYPIKTLSDYTRIPWLLLQQARAKDIPIDSKYAQALIYGMEKKNNDIAYNGDVDYGLQGIFTSQVPRLNAASTFAGVSGTTQLDRAQARLDILNTSVTAVIGNCQGIWQPKIVAMPMTQFQLLTNDIYTTATGKTTLGTFLENQSALSQIQAVIPDNTLIGKGENGTDAMLILPGPNPEMNMDLADTPTGNSPVESGLPNYPIYYGIARDFDVPMEFMQWHDTIYRERAVERVCGLVVEDPLTALIVSGI